jgi:hypothetical protein
VSSGDDDDDLWHDLDVDDEDRHDHDEEADDHDAQVRRSFEFTEAVVASAEVLHTVEEVVVVEQVGIEEDLDDSDQAQRPAF